MAAMTFEKEMSNISSDIYTDCVSVEHWDGQMASHLSGSVTALYVASAGEYALMS